MSEQVEQNKTVTAIVPARPNSDGSFNPDSREDVRSLFVEWLALPEELRDPRTQKEFGKRYGISQQTLSSWKTNKKVHARVLEMVGANILCDFADYMSYLKKMAAKGDIAAIKVYLGFVHGWSERIEHSGRVALDVMGDVTVGGNRIERLPLPNIAEPDGTRVN